MANHKSIVAIIVGTIAFASAAAAEEPYDITTCSSWKLSSIVASEELTVTALDAFGITQSHHENKAFDNSTVHCVGVMTKMSDASTLDGYCKYLEPNGDIVVGRFKREGGNGTWKFVHGTGKWKGIAGGGTYEVVAQGKPVAPGTFQGCTHATGTFTLPK
jgi:hypothetical protein